MEESINQRISRLRKKKGYTQKTVSEMMGLKGSTYSQMERKGNITANAVIELAKILEVSTDEILFGEEMSPQQAPEEAPLFQELPYRKDAYHWIIEITNDDYNFLRSFWSLSHPKRLKAHRFVYDMSVKRL